MPLQTMFPLGLWKRVRYLLFDQFITSASAPITSPRTCEPGPGTFALTDTGNKLSITGGRLTAASQTAGNDPRVMSGATIVNFPGRVFYAKVRIGTNGDMRMGFNIANSSTPNVGLTMSSAVLQVSTISSLNTGLAYANNTDYEVLIVLRGRWGAASNAGTGGGGVLIFIKGGVYTNWRLLGTTNQSYASPYFAGLGSFVGTGGWSADDIQVRDLCGVYGTIFGFATQYSPYPWTTANPTTWTILAEAFIECCWTAVTSETFEIRTRRTDDNNCWIIRCSQTGATIKIIEMNAGVETERASAAQTWTNAVAFRIRIRQEGTTIRVNVLDGTSATVSYTSASFNQTATGIKFMGHTLLQDSAAWPLTFPNLDITTEGERAVSFLAYGDSKTAGTGDTTPPGTNRNGYPPILADFLMNNTRGAYERPTRLARGGATVAVLKANIDADIAAVVDVPDYILINMGVNDSGVTIDSTWKGNYGYILDALHTKWPQAKIYCMRVWGSGPAMSVWNTIASAIAEVISTRSSFAFIGPDERVFLENGDNGATYTTDGIHPNHAGYVLTAQKWKEVIGL